MPPLPDSLPGLPADYVQRFYVGDVVHPVNHPDSRYRVLRSWGEEDSEMPPLLPGEVRGPLDRALKRGEVGLSDILDGTLSIVPESKHILFSRDFMRGDVVKRALTQAESAVVVDIESEVRLETITRDPSDRLGATSDWVAWKKLKNSLAAEQRDRVVYDEWIGTVEEVVEDGIVQPMFGPSYRISEMGGALDIGGTPEIAMSRDEYNSRRARNLRLPPHANPEQDVIVDVKPAILLITWNAINQMLPVEEQAKHPEPKRFWYGEDVSKLALYDLNNWVMPQLGLIVAFDSEDDQRAFAEARSFLPRFLRTRLLENHKWRVVDTRSRIKLRWQDGSESWETTKDIVPYRNVDDYESWPSDHVMWRGEDGESRPAVLQTFDPRQRVARLLFTDDNTYDTVPVMELDPGGLSRPSYGVKVGQHVLLCENNGAPFPQVPSLGQHELPIDNLAARDELSTLAEQHERLPNGFQSGTLQKPSSDIAWWGEVVDQKLDGLAVVRLANGEVVERSVRQLVALNDPFAHPHDDAWDEWDQGDEEGSVMDVDDAVEEVLYYEGEDGRRVEVGQDGEGDDAMSQGSWETMDGGDQHQSGQGEGRRTRENTPGGVIVGSVVQEQAQGEDEEMEAREAHLGDTESQHDVEEVNDLVDHELQSHAHGVPNGASGETTASAAIEETMDAESGQSGASPVRDALAPASTSATRDTHVNGGPGPSSEADLGWERFEMLEAAPEEHHYFAQTQQGGSRQWMSRVQKEHKALMSSLPENILVRAYEDRLDLLRVLIFGPEGTPYNDAPFVFDVFLDPTKFPNEPPAVYFHSHTNSMGRCNPNLYEEGKVCLSILGTWAGDQSESWSPTKSSLLQVFVSISGLVLVRSPYHCEPAFAKLEGTREGRINSRLYSEKAYVLSRSFVRTALTRPPASLEAEIRHYYLQRGKLRSVIDHARSLMDKSVAAAVAAAAEAGPSSSAAAAPAGGMGLGLGAQDEEVHENEEMWNADAMGSLTQGAVISLKRTIAALEKILATHEAASIAAA